MSAPFIINNRPVDRRDWNAFLEALEEFGVDPREASSDGNISADEVRSLLDADGDGTLAAMDLVSFNLTSFADIKTQLSRHGLDLSGLIEEFNMAVVPEELKDDREMVLGAAQLNGVFALPDASKRLQHDQNILEAAVEVTLPMWRAKGAWHMRFAKFLGTSSELLSNVDLMKLLARHDWRVVYSLTSPVVEEVWRSITEPLREEAASWPFSMESLEDFERSLAEQGVEFPGRFQSLQHLAEAIRQRKLEGTDQRPVVLLIYPSADWNGAFDAYPVADQLIESGLYRVVYYEAGSDQEAEEILRRITKDGENPVHTLILAGHGTSLDLAWATGNEDASRLEIRDFDGDPLGDLIAKSVTRQVVLYSCSTGEGREKGFNLTNAMADRLSKGVRLISPDKATNIRKMTIEEGGDISIEWAQEGGYETRGQHVRPKNRFVPDDLALGVQVAETQFSDSSAKRVVISNSVKGVVSAAYSHREDWLVGAMRAHVAAGSDLEVGLGMEVGVGFNVRGKSILGAGTLYGGYNSNSGAFVRYEAHLDLPLFWGRTYARGVAFTQFYGEDAHDITKGAAVFLSYRIP